MSGELGTIRKQLASVVTVRLSDGIGTGFYATSSGLIITSGHVVGTEHEVAIKRYDRTRAQARVVRVAGMYDLALVWDETPNVPPPLAIRSDPPLSPGDRLYAIGHPIGLEFTLTQGIVSAADRVVHGVHYLQTDTVIQPGSSGGPLLDEQGRVVGVATFGLKVEGLNFALAARYVNELLGEVSVRPGEPRERMCVMCGTRNKTIRRVCRRCGAQLAGAGDAPPRSRRPPPVHDEHETPAPPMSVGERDPKLVEVLSALESLAPAPTVRRAAGRIADLKWNDLDVSISIAGAGESLQITMTNVVLELGPDDAPGKLRLALEINTTGTAEAKLGVRGAQLCVVADRHGADLVARDFRAMLHRLAETRTRFNEQLAARG